MLSLRSLARSVPRSTSRLCTVAAQASRQSARFQSAWKPATTTRFSAAFSTSRPRYEVNEELAAKLGQEISYEEQQQDDEQRQTVEEYISNCDFQLEDIAGQEEVFLTRTYGDEKIKVTFSVADFNQDPEADSEDPAMYDEEDAGVDMPTETQSGGANTKGSVNQGKTAGGNIKMAPEDDIAPGDRDELRSDEDAREPGFAARVQVQVTREGKGALTIECIAQDGDLTIDNVYYFPTTEMAEAKTAESDYSRRSIYTGPPFGQLDEELQVMLERYLEERGVNTAMALFIPDYIDMKENQEYLRWLNNLKNFVE